MEWVDWFNNRRLLSSIGYVPPVEFGQAHYRETQVRPRRIDSNPEVADKAEAAQQQEE